MAEFIPLGSSSAMWGGALGNALGSGVGHALQQRLEEAATERANRLMGQRYEQFGIAPNIASALSTLPPELQKSAFQNLPVLQELSRQQGFVSPQQSPLASLQQQLPTQQPQIGAQAVPATQAVGGLQPQQQVQQPTGMAALSQQPAAAPNALWGDVFKSPFEKRETEKLDIARERLRLAQEAQGLKKEAQEEKSARETRKELEPIEGRITKLKDNIQNYKILQNQANKNNLRAGNSQQLMEKLGLPLFGANVDTQIVQKIASDLQVGATEGLPTGTRLNQYIEKLAAQRIPSLLNTPSGIWNLSRMRELADTKLYLFEKAKEQIISDNKGKIPANLNELARKKVQKKIDRIENEIVELGSNPLPLPSQAKKIRNPDTGKIYISDGTKWTEEK